MLLRLLALTVLPTTVLAAGLLWMLLRQRSLAVQRQRMLNDLSSRILLLDEELDTLSYTVSHELRGPVQVIRGFVELVLSGEGGAVDGPARQYLDRVQRNAARMDALMNHLVSLSRLTREKPHRQYVDVHACVLALVQRVQERLPERAIECAMACGVPGSLHVEADPRLFATLLENLIDNAAKFSKGPGPCCIEVHTRRDRDDVVIEVADRGIGFPQELSRKMFRPFQRLHANASFPGAGMGLAIAARIARLHGGTIDGRNRPGGGAVFEVRMPQYWPQAAVIANATEAR